tara:strand:- start:4968 stop:5213 length:246 start_codon:yes stop_codon:yes gene_type:complete
MAGYDMKHRPSWDFLYNTYSTYNQPKNIQSGLPQSLFDLFINKKMGFNIGDRGYLNFRLPKTQQGFDRGDEKFNLDLTYDL